MEIEYNQMLEDILTFNRYHTAHSPTIKALRLRGAVTIPVLILVFYGILLLLQRDPGAAALKLWFLPAIALLYLIIYPACFRRSAEANVKRVLAEGANKGMLGWHKIHLTPDMITQTTEYRQTSVKWEAVEKVIRGNGYLYVYDSALTAMVIPEHAFPTQEEFLSFAGRAQDYFSAKQQTSD